MYAQREKEKMKNSEVNTVKSEFRFDAVVIGTGCAGYNCADKLYEYGYKNIAIVTEGRNMGTSRNTGSDKQTYYKMSLAGNEGDSVFNMAKTLFDGGAVDGDIALCEAANSVSSFIRLAELGVAFPTNEFGEYVGYKTDHDPYQRATSIGPYTSKKMTEVLENSVLSKKITVIDNCQIIDILTDNGAVTGLLGIDVISGKYIVFETPYVVLATGGPASIYYDSVYPLCHTGASSLALDAGAEFVNLSEWQYGLASTDYRWNVSGTYQQVLPRYISVDEQGNEREFLLDSMSRSEMLKRIFLKGYEWPFDVKKVQESSYIDLLVYRETVLYGRTVYMDFTREPSGLEGGFNGLDKTTYDYLKNSEALLKLPINRLKKMNPRAVDLYKENGIDIEKEPLKIAVCAQHNNGGVSVDKDWQTNIKGLYACGEAAGTFGIFRPGGAALNSTQVGSMRCARHIAFYASNKISDRFDEIVSQKMEESKILLTNTGGNKSSLIETRCKYQKFMSEKFAFLRNLNEMKDSLEQLSGWYDNFEKDNKWKEVSEIAQLYKNLEVIKMQNLVAKVMLTTAEKFGSRGSAFVFNGGNFIDAEPIPENEIGRKKLLVFRKNGDMTDYTERDVRLLPERDLWFERVWNKFNDERKQSQI